MLSLNQNCNKHIANQEATGAIIRSKVRWIEEGEKMQNISYL